MSTKYKATDMEAGYFVTITSVGWIDIFTRLEQKNVLIRNLNYCRQKKGLEIYAYCIMSSHLHMICKAVGDQSLSNIMRDFKKFTAKEIVRVLQEHPESRRDWMLDYFRKACEHLTRDQQFKVWQTGYHAELLVSQKFIKQKLNYIHNNPVKEGIVQKPEDYLFSSARNYSGFNGELEVVLLDWI